MNRLQVIVIFLIAVLFANAYTQDFSRWEPTDGAPIRQGSHIEWFRAAETRDAGELEGETGIAWSDCRFGDRGVFTQMIDVNGNVKFDERGLQVADAPGRQEDVGIWPDPDGGWFFAWEDFDSWMEDGEMAGDSLGDIYCTKIDRNGNRLWAADVERGVAVVTFPGIQEDVRIVHDGQGGCIIAWRDMRGGDTGDIYAQHIMGNGRRDPDWPEAGLQIVAVPGAQINHTADVDGSGGMIIGWKDGRLVANSDIWAQRITSGGDLLWGEGQGIPICNNEANQQSPKLCPDGRGGAFFSWTDERNSGASGNDIYVQRVNADGELLWGDANEGSALCTAEEEQIGNRIVISEQGTAIVLWEDERNAGDQYDLYAQRINGEDQLNTTWTDQGAPVVIAPAHQTQSRVYPDGQGGAYFVWEDERFGGHPEVDIWAQRLNANGQRLWGETGVVVCGMENQDDVENSLGNQNSPLIRRTADGGCVIAWEDQRIGSKHLYAQRLEPNSDVVWERNGIMFAGGLSGNAINPLIFTKYDGAGTFCLVWEDGRFMGRGPRPYIQFGRNNGDDFTTLLPEHGFPVISEEMRGGGISFTAASSDDGGIMVAWQDQRPDQAWSVYAQKIVLEQNQPRLLWSAEDNGVRCAEFDDEQSGPIICSDEAGGAILAWQAPTDDDYWDIYMQRISAEGNPMWTESGIIVTGNEVDELVEAIIPDGEGGAVILYKPRPRATADDLWINRVNAAGEKQWGDEGLTICNEPYDQHKAVLKKHPEGFVVVWVDGRDDQLGQSQNDIYGQFISNDGTLQWVNSGYMICGAEYHQSDPDLVIDTEGNCFIVWVDNRFGGGDRRTDLYLQKLGFEPDERRRPSILFTDEDGDVIYDGIPICAADADQLKPKMTLNMENGVWVIWEDYRVNDIHSDIFALNLRANGELFPNWTENGDMVCGATHRQIGPNLGHLGTRPGENLGVVIVWEDKRATGKDELSNVYVQRLVDPTVSTPISEKPSNPHGYRLESIYPNPFNSQALVTFVAQNDGIINLAVFDITGRKVFDLGSGYWSAGRHVMVLDGSGLAAGTYLVRLEVNDIHIERSIQLIK